LDEHELIPQIPGWFILGVNMNVGVKLVIGGKNAKL